MWAKTGSCAQDVRKDEGGEIAGRVYFGVFGRISSSSTSQR